MSLAPFGFATAGAIRFGRGVRAEAATWALARARRVLVVRSASVDAADDLIRELSAGAEVRAVNARGEPDLPGLTALCDEARGFAPGIIVAIGGGAVIDTGKALAALIPAPHGALRYLEVVGEGKPLDAAPLPLVAIPTTAGTGSEVTRNAVIGIPEAGRKVSLRDPRLYPALALVDPELAARCPKGVTLASGLDAVVQVIEPFVSARANPLTDALCRDAIPRGLAALRKVVEGGDAWDDMVLTSVMGGLALANAGLGAVHGLAGVIGGVTGAAHGAICGAALVPVLRANRAAVAQGSEARARIDWVIARIAEVYGDLDGLQGWARDHGLPKLSAMGVTEGNRRQIAEEARRSSSYAANPVDLGIDALTGILEQG